MYKHIKMVHGIHFCVWIDYLRQRDITLTHMSMHNQQNYRRSALLCAYMGKDSHIYIETHANKHNTSTKTVTGMYTHVHNMEHTFVTMLHIRTVLSSDAVTNTLLDGCTASPHSSPSMWPCTSTYHHNHTHSNPIISLLMHLKSPNTKGNKTGKLLIQFEHPCPGSWQQFNKYTLVYVLPVQGNDIAGGVIQCINHLL